MLALLVMAVRHIPGVQEARFFLCAGLSKAASSRRKAVLSQISFEYVQLFVLRTYSYFATRATRVQTFL